MKRFWTVFALASAVALVATAGVLAVDGLGAPVWHHNVAFLVVGAAAVAAWRPLAHRRVATLVMAYFGVVATASGFAMLYTKDFPYKDPLTWWHTVTSVAFLLAFLVHWLHNRTRLWEFTRRLFTRDRTWGFLAALAWIGIAAHGARSAVFREDFTRENYLGIASWTIVVGVAFAYGVWLLYRLPALRARLRESGHRNRLRALVDTGLFLANWGALLTGFALLWFAGPLRAGSWKYVSKWWHTATSVAFLALLALHVGFNARLVAAHAQRVDGDLR